MRSFTLLVPIVALTLSLSLSGANQVPNAPLKPPGILILDNCDPVYHGKDKYEDNLTLLNLTGERQFQVTGFNNCNAFGSTRKIASDLSRDCIWVIEDVARRIRRFDLTGKQTLVIPDVYAAAAAVDPQTGNLWAVASEGEIPSESVIVFNSQGKILRKLKISLGWDIVYDRKEKAFWVAGWTLTKITAPKCEAVCSVDITRWCASSLDIDPRTGNVWVAVVKHPNDLPESRNQLLKFSPEGKQLVTVELGEKTPYRVSVDPKDGSVWVAHLNQSIERFSAEGKTQVEHAIKALAAQVDPAGGTLWVVTPTDVQKMTPKCEVIARIKHASATPRAWIAVLE
jgi:hypothetical protein